MYNHTIAARKDLAKIKIKLKAAGTNLNTLEAYTPAKMKAELL